MYFLFDVGNQLPRSILTFAHCLTPHSPKKTKNKKKTRVSYLFRVTFYRHNKTITYPALTPLTQHTIQPTTDTHTHNTHRERVQLNQRITDMQTSLSEAQAAIDQKDAAFRAAGAQSSAEIEALEELAASKGFFDDTVRACACARARACVRVRV